jgi:hypothetical protein
MLKDVPSQHLKRINEKGVKGIWSCSDCLQIEDDLIERHEGKAVYVHASNCPSFCDFACNGNWGNKLANYVNLNEPTPPSN